MEDLTKETTEVKNEKPSFEVISWCVSPSNVYCKGKKGTKINVIDQTNGNTVGSGVVGANGLVIIPTDYHNIYLKAVLA